MSNQICRHFYVSGKVQGVWFRASTKKEADKLGVTGWTCNLADGRVEVVACGDVESVNQLEAWLRQGPELARVSALAKEDHPWETHDRFEVR